MHALIDNTGTAMSETALCNLHVFYGDARIVAMNSAWESTRNKDFVNCGDNEALECVVCGATADTENSELLEAFTEHELAADRISTDGHLDALRVTLSLIEQHLTGEYSDALNAALADVEDAENGDSNDDEIYALTEAINTAEHELSYVQELAPGATVSAKAV